MHSHSLCKSRSLTRMKEARDESDEGAAEERPIRLIRRERFRSLMQAFGGPKKLADALESKDTHLIAISKGRRGIGDALATKIESVCDVPFGWMDQPNSDIPSAIHEIGALLIGSDETVTDASKNLLLRLVQHPDKAGEVAKALVKLLTPDREPTTWISRHVQTQTPSGGEMTPRLVGRGDLKKERPT